MGNTGLNLFFQSGLFKSEDEMADPILTKEGLVVEGHERHTPMPGLGLSLFIGLNDRLKAFRAGLDLRIKFRKVKTCPGSRFLQAVSLIPVLFSLPDDLRDLVDERKPVTLLGSKSAQSRQPVDIRLLFRHFT